MYILKEIVNNYKCLNGSMFMGFLDATSVHSYIVRIMMCWYTKQTVFVCWSRILSEGFHVSNGVRQGGILSLYLINVAYSHCT